MSDLGVLATTADDDDAEDAARAGKKSDVPSSWRTDTSPGHGQSV